VPVLDHRRSPGLDKSTAGRFAKGMMDIEATIDLHGLTQPVAHAALSRFITGSADIGRRCLLVITGKGNREGSGILRAEVPRWLNEPGLRGQILAFTYAQPKHGGGGALYVLLKRRR
jgi:DNA-nicking Smr family endonuclease